MTRRKFSREFKIEAVMLVTERGVPVSQPCRDLDPAESVPRRWMREAARRLRQPSPATGSSAPNWRRSQP